MSGSAIYCKGARGGYHARPTVTAICLIYPISALLVSTARSGQGHEPSSRLDDCEGSTRWLGEVRQMSAIGTQEMINLKCQMVGLLTLSPRPHDRRH